MELKKLLYILSYISKVFDVASTLYFSSILGIGEEMLIPAKLLIQNKEYIWFFWLEAIHILATLKVIDSVLEKNTKLKYLLFIIPLAWFLGGLTWFYAYFFM